MYSTYFMEPSTVLSHYEHSVYTLVKETECLEWRVYYANEVFPLSLSSLKLVPIYVQSKQVTSFLNTMM